MLVIHLYLVPRFMEFHLRFHIFSYGIHGDNFTLGLLTTESADFTKLSTYNI